MAQWIENAEEEQRSSGFGGAAASIARSWLTLDYSFATLRMIQGGATGGYYVPWTRVVAGKDSRIAGFGASKGWWGSGGLGSGVGRTHARSAALFEQYGFKGGYRAVVGEASREASAHLAGAAFARTGSARVAGRYAARYAGTMGARAATTAGARYLAGRLAGIANPLLGIALVGEQVVGGISGGYQFLTNKFGKSNVLELGGNFSDSQGAVTSRQRALQAITSSQLQARSAIGNEAFLMHR